MLTGIFGYGVHLEPSYLCFLRSFEMERREDERDPHSLVSSLVKHDIL